MARFFISFIKLRWLTGSKELPIFCKKAGIRLHFIPACIVILSIKDGYLNLGFPILLEVMAGHFAPYYPGRFLESIPKLRLF